jgi:4-amino-4-deoxy-L-arabinose transferase-like glycosyltransferase
VLKIQKQGQSHRKTALLLGTVTFFSFLYFYEGGGWNQNSRFDLLRAIVERHTLQIDAYYENTGDKAHFQGHYYSEKAPGLVFLAVPVALAGRQVLRVSGNDPQSPRGEVALSYLVTAGAVALPTALAAVILFFLCLRFTGDSRASLFAALVMCLGTPLWAYASLFWAHALVGACFVFAFAAALQLAAETKPESTETKSAGANRDFLWSLAVGLAAGWATVTEYPAAPASAMLAFFALSQAWPRGNAVRWRVVAGVGVGAAICLAVLLWYLYAAFGSFRPSYSYYDANSFAFMQQRGYMGLTYPHPDRLLKLLFGCSRGLFFASPVMLVAPLGLWWLWRGKTTGEKTSRAAALVAAGIAAYYFLFNASFYWWKAGLSFGPRYAGACIPLLSIGLAVAWQRATPAWRRVLVALALCSVFFALMAVSTTSQLSMQDNSPLLHSAWPAFWSGHMALNRESMLTLAEASSSPNSGAFNLGQLLGLCGLASLLPLFAVWIAAALVWRKLHREHETPEQA